jgi:hypothetical protein
VDIETHSDKDDPPRSSVHKSLALLVAYHDSKLLTDSHHFLAKNDVMFPCAAFPAAFFGFAVEPAELGSEDGLDLLGGGASSSENDSHAASWMVT